MKLNLYILNFIFLGSIFGACKKDKLSGDGGSLIGKWNWVHTEHISGWCIDSPIYQTIYPSDTTITFTLEFIEKGKITYFENGNLVLTDRIVFEYFESDGQGGYFFYIKLDNKDDKILEGSISADTLRVNYPLVETDPDCENYLNFFVRE